MGIQDYMDLYYKAKVLGKGSPDNVVSSFVSEMEGQPELKSEAEAKLDELKNIDPERCFISSVYTQFLERSLNGTAS